MIVYDVTDTESFEKVKHWHTEILKHVPESTPIMIAGNKCDNVHRTVNEADAINFAHSLGAEHISTSAKSGSNVEKLFWILANKAAPGVKVEPVGIAPPLLPVAQEPVPIPMEPIKVMFKSTKRVDL